MLSSFGGTVLHPSVHSNRIYGSGERSILSPVYEYRYGAFSVPFISGGEGVGSDNRVTNTEPLNALLYNHED